MSTESFETLKRAVVSASESDRWDGAVLEWEVTDLRHDPAGHGECICGQLHLVKLFTISNLKNGAVLRPIGSVCVNLFERAELNREVTLLTSLLQLRTAIRAGERVTLTSEYFTRALVDYFWDRGVFTPDQWNHGNVQGEYEFVMKMFNKRDKSTITPKQRYKISGILRDKILPFVEADDRLQ